MNAITDLPVIQRAAIDGAVHIPLALCAPSPTNPRKKFDPTKLAELAASIGKHKLIQPILVRPWPNAKAGQPLYEIVAGERRWRASAMAETGTIMAIVRDMTDFEVWELQLIENLQRSDLHPIEEAEGYARLLRKAEGLQGYANADELAEKIGKSRSYVFQRLKLLDLGKEGREAFADDRLSFSIALLIARLASTDQAKATKQILQGYGGEPMTYRTASEYVQREFMLALDRATFPINDAELVPAAGSCKECPKRTGATPDLFPDVKKADTCTDAACYHGKEEAHRARVKATAEAKGLEVIEGAAAKKIKPRQHDTTMKGYLALDQVHYNIDSSKTLRKLLGKHTLAVKLLEDPHPPHSLVEVVDEAEALAVLKESGKLKRAVMPSTSQTVRENQAKAKRESAWRSEVAREVVEAAGGDRGRVPEVRAELLVSAALLLWSRLESDQCRRVEKLMAWAPMDGSMYDPATTKKHDARLRGLTEDQFAQYLAATVAAREMSVNEYSLGHKPARLLHLAELLHVDAKATQQRLKNEAATRVKAKAAPKAPRASKVPAPAGEAPARAKPGAAEATPETALAAALKKAASKPPAKGKKAAGPAVKYRHPSTGSTWTGRGLQPAWVKAWLRGGHTLAALQVDDPAAAAPAPAPAAQLSAAAADPFRAP